MVKFHFCCDLITNAFFHVKRDCFTLIFRRHECWRPPPRRHLRDAPVRLLLLRRRPARAPRRRRRRRRPSARREARAPAPPDRARRRAQPRPTRRRRAGQSHGLHFILHFPNISILKCQTEVHRALKLAPHLETPKKHASHKSNSPFDICLSIFKVGGSPPSPSRVKPWVELKVPIVETPASPFCEPRLGFSGFALVHARGE